MSNVRTWFLYMVIEKASIKGNRFLIQTLLLFSH